MMQTTKLDEVYNNFSKEMDLKGALNSPWCLLMKEMYLAIKNSKESPIAEAVQEWYTPEEFIKKYDVMAKSSFYTFLRFNPEVNAFTKRCSKLDRKLIKPQLFLEHLYKYQKLHRRTHKKLMGKDYFGFNMGHIEIYDPELQGNKDGQKN